MSRGGAPSHARRSRLRDADGETDNIQGLWPREKLVAMNTRFVEALRRAHQSKEGAAVERCEEIQPRLTYPSAGRNVRATPGAVEPGIAESPLLNWVCQRLRG